MVAAATDRVAFRLVKPNSPILSRPRNTIKPVVPATVSERQQLIPSGRKTYLKSRVDWAKYYLQKAGLIEAAERGSFRITDRGMQVLKSRPDKVDTRFLYQYPEFAAFHTAKRTDAGAGRDDHVEESHPMSFTDQTPEETLEA
ncbi:MAG: winged helix-turn-helix domain-containing protein, partial [Verrucomicrobia bacterium]|nr:winged helix-turn-helix domain-containing protein [Verrucomicrobiota bacterium]